MRDSRLTASALSGWRTLMEGLPRFPEKWNFLLPAYWQFVPPPRPSAPRTSNSERPDRQGARYYWGFGKLGVAERFLTNSSFALPFVLGAENRGF